jgi:dihydrofolate synthase/folylpolyglutamate synthase
MNHAEALAYLEELQSLGVKLGLDNIRRLLRELGSPQADYPCVLVTGSNGKGSVAAMMTASLRAAGLRVGTYTSPHLVALEERVAVDGDGMSKRRLSQRATDVRRASDRLLASGALTQPPTFFESVTAIGLLEFSRRKVDIAVIEVGLGGRFDATNATEPLVSVVTNIALEHTRYLGNRLEDIAFEKAGIARPGRPLVVGVGGGHLMRVLRGEAERRQAEFRAAPRRTRIRLDAASRRGLVMQATTARGTYPLLRLPLPGRHQAQNVATAITALEALPKELRPSPTQIARGLARTRWPGRLEYHPGKPRLLLDGAHNPAAASNLARYLREFETDTRRVLLFGCMGDKNIEGVLTPLLRGFEGIVLTQVANPRAAPISELGEVVERQLSHPPQRGPVVLEKSPRRALDQARALAGRGGLVVVCGSLYLVGDLLAANALTAGAR